MNHFSALPQHWKYWLSVEHSRLHKRPCQFLARCTKCSSFRLHNLHCCNCTIATSATWGFRFTSLLDIKKRRYLTLEWLFLALPKSGAEYYLLSQFWMWNLLTLPLDRNLTQLQLASSRSGQTCAGHVWMLVRTRNIWADQAVTEWQKTGLQGVPQGSFMVHLPHSELTFALKTPLCPEQRIPHCPWTALTLLHCPDCGANVRSKE